MIYFGLACLLIFIWAGLTMAFLYWWHTLMVRRDQEDRAAAGRPARHRQDA